MHGQYIHIEVLRCSFASSQHAHRSLSLSALQPIQEPQPQPLPRLLQAAMYSAVPSHDFDAAADASATAASGVSDTEDVTAEAAGSHCWSVARPLVAAPSVALLIVLLLLLLLVLLAVVLAFAFESWRLLVRHEADSPSTAQRCTAGEVSDGYNACSELLMHGHWDAAVSWFLPLSRRHSACAQLPWLWPLLDGMLSYAADAASKEPFIAPADELELATSELLHGSDGLAASAGVDPSGLLSALQQRSPHSGNWTAEELMALAERTSPALKRAARWALGDCPNLARAAMREGGAEVEGKSGREASTVLSLRPPLDVAALVGTPRSSLWSNRHSAIAELASLEWLRNRTFLFVGESLDVLAVEWACGASLWFGVGASLNQSWTGRTAANFQSFTLPAMHRGLSVCHYGALNLTLMAAMHYGVFPMESDKHHFERYMAPDFSYATSEMLRDHYSFAFYHGHRTATAGGVWVWATSLNSSDPAFAAVTRVHPPDFIAIGSCHWDATFDNASRVVAGHPHNHLLYTAHFQTQLIEPVEQLISLHRTDGLTDSGIPPLVALRTCTPTVRATSDELMDRNLYIKRLAEANGYAVLDMERLYAQHPPSLDGLHYKHRQQVQQINLAFNLFELYLRQTSQQIVPDG